MRELLAKALEESGLEDEATKFARKAIGDAGTVVDSHEALVEIESFLRTYSIRAENLVRLGKPVWNFAELLKAVEKAGANAVRVSLLSSPYRKIVVVRNEEGKLLGCAAFGA